jgi:hypothetical protein
MAGLYTNGTGDRQGRLFNELMNDHERNVVNNVKYLLESYHYIKGDNKIEVIERDKARVFLDSGAFSAFTLGKTIDLNAYCDFIHKHLDCIEQPAVLDAIGDAFKTYQNQTLMEQRGIRPIPCFHFGEDERYMEHYMANYDYIALGGVALAGSMAIVKWLDRLFEKYICGSDGIPKVKIHGFAITSVPLMLRYPWYSVDSSMWVQAAFRGEILVPEIGRVAISNNSPTRKEDGGKHIATLSEIERQAVLGHIEKRGFDAARLWGVYISRWVFNLAIFNEMNIEWENKVKHFQAEQISIF